MRYRIAKGKHRAWPIMPGVWLRKKLIRKQVRFDPSCKYHLGGKDQEDWNKLFGIGFTKFWKLLFVRYLKNEHHSNSARFVWRYLNGNLNIGWYVYDDGFLLKDLLYMPSIGGRYILTIEVHPAHYTFKIQSPIGQPLAEKSVAHSHQKKWSYALGCYFGGNWPAPKRITIEMSKA